MRSGEMMVASTGSSTRLVFDPTGVFKRTPIFVPAGMTTSRYSATGVGAEALAAVPESTVAAGAGLTVADVPLSARTSRAHAATATVASRPVIQIAFFMAAASKLGFTDAPERRR